MGKRSKTIPIGQPFLALVLKMIYKLEGKISSNNIMIDAAATDW